MHKLPRETLHEARACLAYTNCQHNMLPQELTILSNSTNPSDLQRNRTTYQLLVQHCSPLLLKFGILMVVTWGHPKTDENDHASTVNYVDLAMQCVNE